MSILIVDDIADNRLLLQAVLEFAGYDDILEAENADEALRLLGLGAGDKVSWVPDLILMDIMMPGIDGIEATRRIKEEEHLHDVPVLMVTAKAESADLEAAFDAGAMDYVMKPFDEPILLARVRNALRLRHETEARKQREAEMTEVLVQLRRDMCAAGALQASMLPPQQGRLANIDYAHFYQPCSEVGGDHLNVYRLNDEQMAIFLLDVSGHGVPSSLLSVTLNRHLADITPGESVVVDADGRARKPSAVVARLNQQYQMDDEQAIYFTMFYGVFHIQERRLDYVQAGHPAMVVSRTQAGVKAYGDGDMPVGMLDFAHYTDHRLCFESGDRFYLYSDGLVEAEYEGEQYGESRLCAAIMSCRSLPLAETVNYLEDENKRWLAGQHAADDVTILALEVS